MKPAMSLMLILAVVTSTLPVAAQVQTEPTDGPIARAGAREVAHYAAQSTAVEGSWSQVLTIKPGTEITVRNREGQAADRYFLTADDSQLILLNLDAVRSVSGKSALRNGLAMHPEYFVDARSGVSRSFNVAATSAHVPVTHVRLDPSGVFVANKKVAELPGIFQAIRRGDVVEVRTGTGEPIGHPVLLATLIGFGAGLSPGLVGAATQRHCDECYDAYTGAALGGGIGAGMGAIIGKSIKHGRESKIIYRIP
jgi:hypothetical protein